MPLPSVSPNHKRILRITKINNDEKVDDNSVPSNPESENKAPDYNDKNNWLRQPEATKDVDVFYVYPTEYADDSEGASMFADINDKSLSI